MANIASRTATVEYDEAVTSVARLKDKISECGFLCAGQIVHGVAAPSPRLRGEGRGKGGLSTILSVNICRSDSRKGPLTRIAARSDLSPQAGRGTAVPAKMCPPRRGQGGGNSAAQTRYESPLPNPPPQAGEGVERPFIRAN
jgi:hypothetical protein